MEQNKQTESSSRTITLEPEIKTEQKNKPAYSYNLFSADTLKAPAPKNEEKTPVQQLPQQPVMARVSHINPQVLEKTVEEIQTEQPAEEVEEKTEEQITETLFGELEKIESTGEEEIKEEIETYTKSYKKGYAFRAKLFTGVMCLLIALFGGWVIGTAIEISSVSSNIESTTQTIAESQELKDAYDVKLLDYINKISQLDNWNEDNVNSDASLVPIEEIIPITPTPLTEPTEYEEESNWFDKICNFISKLFGG